MASLIDLMFEKVEAKTKKEEKTIDKKIEKYAKGDKTWARKK